MATSCAPSFDKVYGTLAAPVMLCPDCGAIVPVTADDMLRGAAVVPAHGDRVVGGEGDLPAMTPAELDAAFTEILGDADGEGLPL